MQLDIRFALHPAPEAYRTAEDLADWEAYGPRQLTAYLDGTEVGWIAWYAVGPEGEPYPSVIKVRVEPEHRRRGIATALMDDFLRRHPDGDVLMGRFLAEGRRWWTAYCIGRADLARFVEDFNPDLEPAD